MTQHQKYTNRNPIHQFVLNRFLGRVESAVRAANAKTVLDLASAQGYVIRYLSRALPTVSFVGVDIDTVAIAEARTLNPRAKFCEGNIYTYAHPAPVDLVMALEVFEHLDDVPRALENISQINARFFLFSVPHEPFFRASNFLRGRHIRRFGNHPEHVNQWSKRGSKMVLESRFDCIADYSSFPWTMFLTQLK